MFCVGLWPLMQRGSAVPVVYTTGVRCAALRAQEIAGRVEAPVVYTTGIRCAALRARGPEGSHCDGATMVATLSISLQLFGGGEVEFRAVDVVEEVREGRQADVADRFGNLAIAVAG
ncbi:hypothetical protein EC9_28710 [Rosistilla ulvae]|uniref:Uncharacterized protein n=1 Tax=Rosistilla ulvae TaxID=1930277 RepID=A0A517M1C9_9BACT|nr:hypothetical protein EC9_28710 [Rosistilla ulvae]